LLMPPPAPRQRRTGRLVLIVGLLVALVVGAIAFILGAASQRTPTDGAPVSITTVVPDPLDGG
ncbi:MAG: hypothetical protein ABWY93_25410, partial [Mycobacterium sp.]